MIRTRHEKNFANLCEIALNQTENHEIILRQEQAFCYTKKMEYLCACIGEVSEWLKEHAWKVCIRQKCIEGSNPSLSAKTIEKPSIARFFYLRTEPSLLG